MYPFPRGERYEFECPACGGRDPECPECGGSGRWELTECPLRFAGNDAFAVIDAAGDYDRGLPPEPGGSLDQAQVFLDAARFVRADRATWERPKRTLDDLLNG